MEPPATRRWTRDRRRQHTRDILRDAAAGVFARKGFDTAALEEIAEAAGYSRGAIYAHFGSKAELFLAVVEAQRQEFLEGFADLIASARRDDGVDTERLARRWDALVGSDSGERAALGYEFTLFLLRNPDARERVAAQRAEAAQALADYIVAEVTASGGRLRMPALDLAHVILAANDGVTLNSVIDGSATYRPFLELVVSQVEYAPVGPDGAPEVSGA